MNKSYWGNAGPEDDADEPRPPDDTFDMSEIEDPEENNSFLAEEEDPTIDDLMVQMEELLDQLGPACALDVIADYLFDCDRPYHRAAGAVRKLASRVFRADTAVEEGMQTRGLTR